jgi:L-cysteine S-thiosulfotransferase
MRTTIIAIAALVVGGTAPVPAQQQPAVDAARVEATIKTGWPNATAEWQARLVPDATMQQCSATHNNPPKEAADAIKARELASIQYPTDGKLIGDWKKGEALAQSGYGLRFNDYPPARENGGNCYACHQITKAEVSFGTVGPSLSEYGKLRAFKPEDTKATYEKIYNSHASFPCSLMPRFGSNKVLTIEQIKDLVALLMSPESPVNK